MLRHIALTVIAVAFFVIGMVLYFQNRGTPNSGALMFGSMLVRCGVVLGLASLALGQVTEFFTKYPPWLVGGASLSILVTIIQPKALIILVPAILAMSFVQFWGWLMKPPVKKKKRQD